MNPSKLHQSGGLDTSESETALAPYPANEAELRALRDRVYDSPQTDREWENCKENWSRQDSVEWLRKKAIRPIVLDPLPVQA